MKTECGHCEDEFQEEELENWGHLNLCPECVEYYKREMPAKQKRKHMELKIEKPRSDANAQYNPNTGFAEFTEVDNYPEDAERVINHEFMHYIIHREIGLRVCYQYDSIHDYVDPYHDS